MSFAKGPVAESRVGQALNRDSREDSSVNGGASG
jgi:hypothetical protein